MKTDMILNIITKIRNSFLAKNNYLYIIYSKLNLEVIKILYSLNYFKNYKILNNNIKITLNYNCFWKKNKPFFNFKCISKSSKKIFIKYKNFLKYNQGIAILNTSLGIMSNSKAIKLGIGGEILFYIN